jgi:hypothetical protein
VVYNVLREYFGDKTFFTDLVCLIREFTYKRNLKLKKTLLDMKNG